MILYLLANSILFFKLIIILLVRIFLLTNTLAKIIVIIILLLGIKYCIRYPRKRFKKLSELRNYRLKSVTKYALLTKYAHVYNMLIISIYAILTIFIVFFFRYSNMNKIINLKEIYEIIKKMFLSTESIIFSINLILFILIIIFYLLVFTKLITYFKFHIIKRHLYLMPGVLSISDSENWYELRFFYNFLFKIFHIENILENVIKYIYDKCYYQYQEKQPDIKIDYSKLQEGDLEKLLQFPVKPKYLLVKYSKILPITLFIITKWHYILCFILFIYDCIYNHYQIQLIFVILPWIFLYEIYLRIYRFVDSVWLPYDQYIHTVLYCKNMSIYDSHTLVIDNKFYDFDYFKYIYNTYIKRDFIKDSNNLK